ncbi:acyltransferase family protein [Moritella dasanensis]|uniref:acyltransferase family protein n=1 Tax=Moritella dasanensis TaxID=428031 RepID=UPI0002D7E015|nr:acyltransferase family protein [Moritella dasanensis]
MDFRRDINGLRAIAVIGVILYHFNANILPGGFAGVDVFFVISGFLMTSIIFRDLTNDIFSLPVFYLARAKRIIPPLLILCCALLLFGWMFVIPPDFQALTKHVHKSLNFLSNITYWQESGYFDVDAELKWLLHTWSLSVEWQFYIVYPLLLLMVKQLVKNILIPRVIIACSAISFIACVYVSWYWPNSAFYLLPTRAWEMLLGGLAFLYPRKLSANSQKWLFRIGIMMIIASYILLDSANMWPGYLAAVPVLGTIAVIMANQGNNLLSNNSTVQLLGRTSYSTYLWHWPIFVALSYYYIELSLLHIASGISASIFMGWLSYTLIEKRAAKYKGMNVVFILLYLGVFSITFSSISSKYLANEINFSIPNSVKASIKRAPAACFDNKDALTSQTWLCSLGDDSASDTRFIVMGDSHMYSQLPAFNALASRYHLKGQYTGFSGCPPLLGVYPQRSDQVEKNCFKLNNKLYDYVKDNAINRVFLSARWSYYTEFGYNGTGDMVYLSAKKVGRKDQRNSFETFQTGVKETIKRYNDIGVSPVVILQVPQQKLRPEKLYYTAYLQDIPLHSLAKNSISIQDHRALQQRVNNVFKELAESDDYALTIVDPVDTFCNRKSCIVGTATVSYYFDKDHLAESGAMYLLPQLINAVNF